MNREERRAIMGQGVVLPETPRERAQLAGLAEDLQESPLSGRRLALRQRNFQPAADGYLAALGGPLPYMLRLREIDALTTAHAVALAQAWQELAAVEVSAVVFEQAWLQIVERWSFDEVNDLIERHNRWYPAESRLPMDPKTGDYALVNGRDYRREPLDASWALARFPADRNAAVAAAA